MDLVKTNNECPKDKKKIDGPLSELPLNYDLLDVICLLQNNQIEILNNKSPSLEKTKSTTMKKLE